MRVALNGFGRIGRAFFKRAWDMPDVEIVGVNTRSDVEEYAHLLKYDSVYGIWDHEVSYKTGKLVVDGRETNFSNVKNGKGLPWKELEVDLVVDATGKPRIRAQAKKHLDAGSKYVMVTSPMEDPDITLIKGINEGEFDPAKHKVIAAASCTSVCSGLTIKVLDENFGIEHGMVTTVHALTGTQQIMDTAKENLRRARAATQSIIPTTTGATKTLGKLFPHLNGKLSGISLRVPILAPSLVTFAAELKKETSIDEVNKAFSKASETDLKGSLDVTDLPLVSVDFIQNPHGAIVDLLSTEVIDKKMVNVLSWYDNEWGYTSQIVDLVKYLDTKINAQ